MIESKMCTTCKITKPLTEFGKHALAKSGIRYQCKKCAAEAGVRYYAKNRGTPKFKAAHKKAYLKRNRDKTRFIGKRYETKKRGLAFEISFDDYMSLRSKTTCACCGAPIATGKNVPLHSRLAIDRRDNSLGYIPGNCFAVCGKCNHCKSNLSVAEVTAMLSYMKGEARAG